MTDITSALDRARRELLDLGLRNSLVNHRRRARQVRVLDELSAEVFRILVLSGRKMSFDAAPEETIEQLSDGMGAGEPQPAAPMLMAQPEDNDSTGPADRHTDNRLQTGYSSMQLQRLLLSIHNTARTIIEEQGVNTLYLALGFLHWFESDNAREPRRAPLVLVPVDLKRASAREKFRVTWSEDDIGDNLSLVEKLKAEFAIQLPPIVRPPPVPASGEARNP